MVEHDEDTIRAADHIVDIGPGAYLSGRRAIPTPAERRSSGSRKLTLVGCERNNLSVSTSTYPWGAWCV